MNQGLTSLLQRSSTPLKTMHASTLFGTSIVMLGSLIGLCNWHSTTSALSSPAPAPASPTDVPYNNVGPNCKCCRGDPATLFCYEQHCNGNACSAISRH